MNQLPSWLKKKTPKHLFDKHAHAALADIPVHSVCASAQCPNRGECFDKKTMTFMILGDACTRHCGFCAVTKAVPTVLDEQEPVRVALAAKRLGLSHVVITSVTRDDLPDGGAGHFKLTVQAVHAQLPEASIEVLTPDFQGKGTVISTLLHLPITVFNHNVETVPRLYPTIRPQAGYERSLQMLRYFKEHSRYIVKSGLMVGLGEEVNEVYDLLHDLQAAGCMVVTIGQYLRPSAQQAPVIAYITPEQFEDYAAYGRALGMTVFAGPWVRSSYQAEELYTKHYA